MSEHEVAPLTASETARLRAIAQELTRTDPRLLLSRHERRRAGIRPGAFGATVSLACVLVGAAGVALGALPTLAIGVAALVAGVVAAAIVSRRSAPGC